MHVAITFIHLHQQSYTVYRISFSISFPIIQETLTYYSSFTVNNNLFSNT